MNGIMQGKLGREEGPGNHTLITAAGVLATATGGLATARRGRSTMKKSLTQLVMLLAMVLLVILVLQNLAVVEIRLLLWTTNMSRLSPGGS